MVSGTAVAPVDLPMADRERYAMVAARLLDYHDVRLDDLMELVGGLCADGDTVIAGGPLAWGLGHRLSDLDVVVCASRTAGEADEPVEHRAGSLRLACWTRSHGSVERLLARARAALAGGGPVEPGFGGAERELLHRIAFGLRVAGPPLPDDGATLARDLLVRAYAERMRESALIAQLAARAGHRLAATGSARQALEECLLALLAARGVPVTDATWLRERLAVAAPDLCLLYDSCSELPSCGGLAGDEHYVNVAVASCQRLAGTELEVEILSLGLSWGLAAEALDLALHQAGDQAYLVARGIGGIWRLTPGEAAAWRALTAPGPGPWRNCDEEQTVLLTSLYGQGLVTPLWDRGLRVRELEGLGR